MASAAKFPRHGQEHLRQVLGFLPEIAPILILVVDQDGCIRYLNPACEKLTGYSRAEVLGTNVGRFLPPGTPDTVLAACLNHPCGQALPEPHVVPWLTKSGDQRIIEWRCAAVGGGNGEARFVLGVGRDVTQEVQTEAALHDMETLNRVIAGLISDYAYIFRVTRRGGLLGEWMAESFRKVFGLKPDRVGLHNGWKRLIHPEDFPRALEHVRKVTSGKVDVCVMRWVTSAGEVRWVRNYAHPIYDLSGSRVVRIYGAAQDITERRIAQEKLRESELRNRIIAELISDYAYIFRVTPDGKLQGEWVTESFTKVFGLTREEIDARGGWQALVLPEDIPIALGHAKKVVGGQTDVCEMRWVTADGEVRWLRDYAQPVFDDSGKRVVRIYGAAQDITERKRAEEGLRKSEALFKSLFHDHTAVELLIDPGTGHILDANQAAVNFYGWTRDQLLGMRIQDINTFPPEEVKRLMELVCEQKRVHFEFKHRRADGSIRDVEVSSCRIGINGHRVLHSIIHDVTDRKRAEAERDRTLERLSRSLISTVQAMAAMTEKRDPYTAGHQENVAELCVAIAAEMKLDEDRIRGLRLAAMIHDIGKVGVPADILTKPGRLTPPERSLVETHVLVGYDILKEMEFPWPIARMVLEHHERVNGSGYPNKLTGDQMLVESRIIAVADVVEAIAMHRPYRAARGQEAALAELKKNRGILYDSEVVDACIRLFEKKGYRLEGRRVTDWN